MKRIFLLFLTLFSISLAFGQKVQSSCFAPDSILHKYSEDAYRLTVRRILKNNYPVKDSIKVPAVHTDTLLKALIAIYNATTLKAVDTILKVHTFPNPDLKEIIIAADSNLSWMKNLRLRNIPTGNNQVDNLIDRYKLKYTSFTALKSQPYHIVFLASDSLLNIEPLTKVFASLPGVYYSEQNPVFGSGNDIKDSIFTEYIQLTYSIGWGDCYSGCMYRRFWKFKVYWDCSVEFIESYGNRLPITSTSIGEVKSPKMEIFPNPFNEVIYIKGINEEFSFNLRNTLGQLIKEGNSMTEIKGLGDLETGMYFLNISHKQHNSTIKIVKE